MNQRIQMMRLDSAGTEGFQNRDGIQNGPTGKAARFERL